MLEQAIKACTARGFCFNLWQDRRGGWSAHALGDNVELGPNGALYTRANGFGKTPDAAMKSLIADLEKRDALPEPEPEPEPEQDDFDDLC